MLRNNKVKFIFILCIFLLSVTITGCKSEEEIKEITLPKITCTRQGELNGGSAKLQYEVYYKGDYVQILHSLEKVTSTDKQILDIYENAYKKINDQYKDLEYYTTDIIKTEDSVSRDTTINYGKIDMAKLLEIEGEEDNVIEDGKVKLKTWLEFAKKYGASCND